MGVRERRDREKQKRGNEILDAAEAVFLEKGYEHTTMDEVATQAELSKGTLYLYYKSKEELYLAIRLRAIKKLHEHFAEAISKGNTGLEKVRLIGEAYFRFAEDFPDYFDSLLHFEARPFNLIGSSPLVRESLDMAGKVNFLVSSAVESGIKDGSIRAELHPGLTGMLLWALSSGFVQFIAKNKDMLTQQFPGGHQSAVDTFFNLMIHALKA